MRRLSFVPCGKLGRCLFSPKLEANSLSAPVAGNWGANTASGRSDSLNCDCREDIGTIVFLAIHQGRNFIVSQEIERLRLEKSADLRPTTHH
jgi:hypothetical protein